jgi:hypothetical protein
MHNNKKREKKKDFVVGFEGPNGIGNHRSKKQLLFLTFSSHGCNSPLSLLIFLLLNVFF